jgi:hypothetical protein
MEKQKKLSIALSNIDLKAYRAYHAMIPEKKNTKKEIKNSSLDLSNSGPFRMTEARFRWQVDRCENEKPSIDGKLKTYYDHERKSTNWEGFNIKTEQNIHFKPKRYLRYFSLI